MNSFVIKVLYYSKITFLFAFLLMFSCSEEVKEHPFTYYYWRTQLRLDSEEKKAVQQISYKKLYTRFFDIDKINGQFQPIAVIKKDSSLSLQTPIIPVVFIKNEVLLDSPKDKLDELAKNLIQIIPSIASNLEVSIEKELQIDCDWTASTRENFFYLLKSLQSYSSYKITCTLRLHQVKDRKQTGIPPVEKVYLMCYSTSSPLVNDGKNSILDVLLLKNYLVDIDKYPLKMDVALPIYSWGIVTNHLGKHKLINGLNDKDLQNPHFKQKEKHKYELLDEGFYFGMYMSKGFQVEVESVSEDMRQEVIAFLDKKIGEYNVIYFQLDSKFIKTN